VAHHLHPPPPDKPFRIWTQWPLEANQMLY
jgi:hypothetical protein